MPKFVDEKTGVTEFSNQNVIRSRAFSVTPTSLNETDRTVDAIVATEAPVGYYDYSVGEVVDEIILMSGAKYGEQLKLLVQHQKSDTKALIGAARSIAVSGDQMTATLFFLKNDAVADEHWNKVSQGVLTDVSIGYKQVAGFEIAPGKSANIAGREFAASATRRLRVLTEWKAIEVSLVVIGGDENATIRSEDGSKDSSGIVPVESSAESDRQRQISQGGSEMPGVTGSEQQPTALDSASVERARTEAAAAAVTAERQRCADIRACSEGVPSELVERAINEGFSVDRARSEFLTSIQQARKPGVSGDTPPGMIVGREISVEALGAAVAMRIGAKPQFIGRTAYDPIGKRSVVRERSFDSDSFRKSQEMVLDAADRIRGISGTDFLRAVLKVSNIEASGYDKHGMVSRAMSTPALSTIFTSSSHAILIERLESAEDSTLGWCDERDLSDYRLQELHSFAMNGGLRRRARGEAAAHMDANDELESFRLKSFARQGAIDEMDLLDDTLGALRDVPLEFADLAMELRPDLVYSLVLSNPTMSDGIPLFHAAHGNLNLATPMTTAGLELSLGTMQSQRYGSRNLNVMASHAITNGIDVFKLAALVKSAQVQAPAVTGGPTTNSIPLVAGALTPVGDARMSNGTVDPFSELPVAGAPTSFILASKRRMGVVVGYLENTGRKPVIRSSKFESEGRYGISIDINYSVGVGLKPLAWLGLSRSDQ